MKTNSFEELMVWQKAMDLAVACYKVTRAFPKVEMFGMISQIRRSASSIAANIAEGQARGQKKEFLQFLRVAYGSLGELQTHLMLCERVSLIKREDLDPLLDLAREVGRMLNGLSRAISESSAN